MPAQAKLAIPASHTAELAGAVRIAAQIVLLTTVYFFTARLGLMLAPVGGFATLVWPPSGIALAALLLFGYRLWPGIALGAFLVNIYTDAPPLVALGIATGNTLEPLVGAFALRCVPGFHPSLERLRDVVALLFLAAVLGTTLSATIGVLSLALGGVIPFARFGETWNAWWLGDLVGNLIVAPLLLVWSDAASLRRDFSIRHLGEAIALMLSVIAVGMMGRPGGFDAYLYFPPLIWAALRFGQRGIVTITFVIACVAISRAALGVGAFVGSSLFESLRVLQGFMAIAASAFLVLGAVIAERRLLLVQVQENQLNLKKLVEERTRALAESNALLSDAQELAHIGSFGWSVKSGVLVWSSELYRIYGRSPEVFMPTFEAFLGCVHPEDRSVVERAVTDAVHKPGPFQFEERILRPDGSQRILRSLGRVFADASGSATRVVGFCEDVTERKKAEDALRTAYDNLEERVRQRTLELQESQQRSSAMAAENARLYKEERLARSVAEEAVRARDSFLSVASHELRNPLGVLHLHMELFEKNSAKADWERTVQTAAKMRRQIQRLTQLVDHLLDASRITAGKLQLEYARVDLTAIVRDVVSRLEESMRRAQCSVTVRADASVIGFWDPMRLDQIAMNLLSNASKYGAGKAIEVVVEGDDRWGRLIVKDHGVGIAPADRERIFEQFERVNSGQITGLGLGLWIVRQIVSSFGGTIRVASEIGNGSTFTVELPRRLVDAVISRVT